MEHNEILCCNCCIFEMMEESMESCKVQKGFFKARNLSSLNSFNKNTHTAGKSGGQVKNMLIYSSGPFVVASEL